MKFGCSIVRLIHGILLRLQADKHARHNSDEEAPPTQVDK